jgi:hypothetical protein
MAFSMTGEIWLGLSIHADIEAIADLAQQFRETKLIVFLFSHLSAQILQRLGAGDKRQLGDPGGLDHAVQWLLPGQR